jgi:signal transduction histidine kinase
LESLFSVIIILYALLFYLSNRNSLINRWCAVYVAIASIGVIKEAFLYQAVPFLKYVLGSAINEDVYLGIYSVLTWIAYSFSAPAAIIMGLYFYGLNNKNPKLMSIFTKIVWIPPVVLSLIYHPLRFTIYQAESEAFWLIYSIYNIGLSVVLMALMLNGIKTENIETVKRQKIILCAGIMPPTVYVLITIYVFHLFEMGEWLKAWQWNAVIIAICLIYFVAMAFRSGFLGLKLSAEVYKWDSDMSIAGKSSDYTSHMLKNQTTKMEMCLENLASGLASGDGEELLEEVAILSRSIKTLKNYVERMKRHSQEVRLQQESCRVSDLLLDATPAALLESKAIMLNNVISDNVFILCDKSHMTEVFSNIIINAIESIRENGVIEISDEYNKSTYSLMFKDDGEGMSEETQKKLFSPYFTTKNTERNFGLGLSYCKNVVRKHSGSISGKGDGEKGATITISFPSKRVAISED